MNEVELERRLCAVEDRSKSNSHRLKTVEERQEDMTQLVTSVAAIAQKQLDMIVEKAILAAVSVLVAYMAVKLGLA